MHLVCSKIVAAYKIVEEREREKIATILLRNNQEIYGPTKKRRNIKTNGI